MEKEFVSRQQVELLPERILKAEETNASRKLNHYLLDMSKKKNFELLNILIVGAGGSYPAALFAKHAISNEMRTPNTDAVTPQTAIRIISQFDYISCTWHKKYDIVIGISYSGATPDIKRVADLCQKKHFPFVLITSAKKSQLSELYTESDMVKIISYFNEEDTSAKERGMISMAATLAPITIFDDMSLKSIEDNQEALAQGEKFVNELNISEIAKSIKENPIIHVFYEWDTLPTAADIESKFVEAGIANVILHEKKNFSHGRYTLLYKQPFGLIINLTRFAHCVSIGEGIKCSKSYKRPYDKEIDTFLSEMCKNTPYKYIELGTVAMQSTQWNIEAMTKLPYLITSIGEQLGIDISKPLKPFPEEPIKLYSYDGKF